MIRMLFSYLLFCYGIIKLEDSMNYFNYWTSVLVVFAIIFLFARTISNEKQIVAFFSKLIYVVIIPANIAISLSELTYKNFNIKLGVFFCICGYCLRLWRWFSKSTRRTRIRWNLRLFSRTSSWWGLFCKMLWTRIFWTIWL